MATAQIPSWLSVQPNMPELQRFVKDLPGQFDTSGVEQNYQGQMATNTARGTAASAAAARAAQNRASRMGGSVASSFAQGSMMLPIHEGNQRLMGDMAQYKGGMQAQQSQQRLSAVQAMAQLRAQQLGLRTGYLSDQNRLTQQGDQFSAQLGADTGFRDRQLAQQGSQFDSDLGFREKQLAAQEAARRRAMNSGGGFGGGNNQVWSPYIQLDNLGKPMDAVSSRHMQQADRLFDAQIRQMRPY
jgi:hypothetical protein